MLQSEATQPANRPVTAVGCLLAGDAANTFVLMAAQREGSAERSNYQLVTRPDANLQEHVGQRVRLSGTVEVREAARTQTLATPAREDDDKEQPAGTAGGETPMVQTRTDVAVDRLSVESVSPLGEGCKM